MQRRIEDGEPVTDQRITVAEYLEYWLSVTASTVRASTHVRYTTYAPGASAPTPRFARYFGTSERHWMNLHDRHDIELERDRLAGAFDDIRPLASA